MRLPFDKLVFSWIRVMAQSSDCILRGAPIGPIPECSLGEYILSKVKSHSRDSIIQVNGETGAEQTCWDFLTVSVKLSQGLNKIGFKENDVVGNLLRNSFESAEIIMGTWLSGGVIAPIDCNMTAYELKHMFDLVKPKFIFCKDDKQILSNISSALDLISLSATIIVTNKAKGSVDSHLSFEDLLNVEVDVVSYKPRDIKCPSDRLAAILPSSGSTGYPKAVGITHKNLLFQDLNINEIKFLANVKSALQASHFFWVTGLIIFLRSLTTGMKRIFVVDAEPENILKAIDKHKPEWVFTSPTVMVAVTTHPEFNRFDVSSVKLYVIGGSSFTPTMAEKIKGRWTHATIVQGYGTTEVNGFITINDKNGNILSVGKVTTGVQIKVADVSTKEPLKANSIGEICFKTPGIMKGYVGNEKATKECFDSEGWYKSGDLGYYDESGQVFVIDRIKEMVKVRNMQVSPAEIENVIFSLPGVVEVGVVGMTHDDEVYHLMAFVVKERGSTLTKEQVCSHVENTLSEYKKLTGGVYFLDDLPKGGNGKVQKQKLKEIAQTLFSKS